MSEEKDKELVDELKTRLEYLRTVRAKFEGDWKEAQNLVAPSLFSWDSPGEKTPKRPKRFTSRPTNFLDTLRSGIIGYSISPNISWLKLGFEEPEHADKYGAKDWLEAVEAALYAEFNRSNLYKQTSSFIENAAVYGHAVMLIDEKLSDNKLRFTNFNVGEIWLDVDEYDEVDAVFRRYSMTLKNAAAFFGEDKLHDTLKLDLKDKKKWNNEVTILHAVYRRECADEESVSSKKMKYASVYIDEGRDHLIEEGGYMEFPFAVFIWKTVSGTPYGESPAIHAMSDVKLLNIVNESEIKIVQMSAEPALNVPDDMREATNVVPGGYSYYKEKDQIISPIKTGENYQIAINAEEKIEKRVKDWFHVDFFLALMNERPANITATYVMELQGEKAAVLSDLVVNLNEALTKIIQRSFNLLWRQRKIPQPPESLAGEGAQLKVDFMGPLAQAQKKYHESAGIGQGISLIGAVANLSQDALDVVDFDQTLKSGLTGMGFPQASIREDKDIEELRRRRAEAQAQMQQQAAAMEQQKQLMGNYGKLNEPVKPGSAIDEMNKQMAGADPQGGFYG
jgi:hypothetical protein